MTNTIKHKPLNSRLGLFVLLLTIIIPFRKHERNHRHSLFCCGHECLVGVRKSLSISLMCAEKVARCCLNVAAYWTCFFLNIVWSLFTRVGKMHFYLSINTEPDDWYVSMQISLHFLCHFAFNSIRVLLLKQSLQAVSIFSNSTKQYNLSCSIGCKAFHVLSMFDIRPSIWGRNGAAQGRFYVEWSVGNLCIFMEKSNDYLISHFLPQHALVSGTRLVS